MNRSQTDPVAGIALRRRSSAALSLATAGFALAVGLLTAAPVDRAEAQAQRNWVNPDVIALREEVQALRQEVARVSGGGVSSGGAAGGAPVSGDAYVRLDRIENELRRMIGTLERVEYEQRQSQQTRQSFEEEMRYRLDALERGEVADPALRPSGGFSGANTAGGAVAGFGGPSEAGALAAAGGQAPAAGVPAAGVLGTIESAGAQGAPVVDRPRFEGGAQLGGQAGAPVGAPAGASGAAPAIASADADAVYGAALESLRAGAFDVAEQQFSGFIQSSPSDPRVGDAIYWLGETYYVRGQYDLAARQFLTGFRDHPEAGKAPDSLLKLGMTLAQLNQSAEACATLGQVSVRYPDASRTVLRRAELESRRAGCQ